MDRWGMVLWSSSMRLSLSRSPGPPSSSSAPPRATGLLPSRPTAPRSPGAGTKTASSVTAELPTSLFPFRSPCSRRCLLGRVRVFGLRQLERAFLCLLEVPLLDRLRPDRQGRHARVAGSLRQHLDDRPVARLAGLGHRQELEAVER